MLAEDVPAGKRAVQVGASVLFCFTIAGLVFGFAALKPVLVDSGVYSDLCKHAPCKEQDTRLNFLFVVASSANNVAALPLGAFLDRYGPKVSSVMGGIVFALGCAVFSLGIVTPIFDSYLAGYVLMALGAPAMFLAQFHLSNAFPARSGLVLGAITGAFDASSLPLVFYKLGYFAHSGKPSIKTFFLSYTVIPILLVLHNILLAPGEIYTRPLNTSEPESRPEPVRAPPSSNSLNAPERARRQSSSFSRISYGINDEADDEEIKAVLEGKSQDPIVGVMFGKDVKTQISSSWWLLMLFTVVVQMTRINWYLATVNQQLIYYTGNEELADTLTNGMPTSLQSYIHTFIFLLPLGGIVSIPAIGWLLDTRPMRQVILLMTVMGFAFGVLTMVPNTVLQLLGIAVIVVLRPLFYTAISDYAAKVFGFETFGTVYGLAMTASGLFGLVLTPLDILTKGPLHGSYTPLNIVLIVFGIVSTAILYLRLARPPTIQLDDQPDALVSGVILEEDED